MYIFVKRRIQKQKRPEGNCRSVQKNANFNSFALHLKSTYYTDKCKEENSD